MPQAIWTLGVSVLFLVVLSPADVSDQLDELHQIPSFRLSFLCFACALLPIHKCLTLPTVLTNSSSISLLCICKYISALRRAVTNAYSSRIKTQDMLHLK